MKQYVTTKELCEIYKVSRQAMDYYRKNGLPHEKLGYRTVRYDLEEVQQYFKGKSVKGEKANE